VTEPDDDLEIAEPTERRLPSPTKKDLGWLLVGGGLVGGAITLMRRRPHLTDWIVPMSLVGLGSGILLQLRQTGIQRAEETIVAELDSLDPIARAQVMKAVAKEQIGRLPGVGSSD
jgi:hypothetical protein